MLQVKLHPAANVCFSCDENGVLPYRIQQATCLQVPKEYLIIIYTLKQGLPLIIQTNFIHSLDFEQIKINI